jgi:histone H2A
MGRGVAKQPLNKKRNEKIYRTFYPVHKVRKELNMKCNLTAVTFLASVVEYMISEIVELSTNCAIDQKKKSICPRHVMLAIRNDEELETFFKGVTFTSSGSLVQVHQNLLPPSLKNKKLEKLTTEAVATPAQ